MRSIEARSRSHPRGVAYVRVLAFMVGFGALVVFVSYFYLFPALQAKQTATPQEKKLLAAHSLLLLAVLLFILLCGLLLTFRIGRFFQPRRHKRAKPTVYPDAWAESARRVEIEPPDERG